MLGGTVNVTAPLLEYLNPYGEQSMKEVVGFVGLGTMGKEMARNLIEAGFTVRVYDLLPENIEKVVALGALGCSSVADAARGAAATVSMLPNTPDVEQILYGEGGLLAAPPPGGLIIDMSTIAPDAVRKMHRACSEAGLSFVDAPVSGGPQGASEGTLTIMAGGEPEAFERARPFLLAMGSVIAHVGLAGAGQTVKLCNQLICALNIQAICEALSLARAAGLDLAQLRDVLLGGSAASWMLDRLGPTMIESDPRAGFRIELMLKDLFLVNELARDLSIPVPATALVTNHYLEARAHGEDANGNQALFRVYDRMANRC
jgi:2-hydroxy-3-oxopropionate reductase